jgi:MFS family permease
MQEQTTQEFDSGYANRTLLLFGGFAVFVMYVESMLTPSLPSIASEFNVSASQVSLVLSMYMVSGVALNPIVGKLGDIYGKKRMFTYVLILYASAVTVTGFSPSFSFLVVSRTVQGIGLTMFPLAMSLVREEFPRDMIPRAQGILSGMFGAGFAIGLPLGAYLSNDYGWRTTYHTALPFAILFAVLISARVKESRYRRPNVKLDYLGSILLALSLASIVLALSLGPSWGWTSYPILALIVFGIVMLPPLVAWERKAPEPILNMKLLGQRNVLNANLVVLIAGLGMFLAFQTVVYRLELPPPVGSGYDILSTGLALAPIALIMFVVAPVGGVLISRTGVKPLSVAGSIIGVIGFLMAAAVPSTQSLIVPMIIFAAGIATLMVSTANLLVLTVDPKEMGLATSMNTVFRTLGSSLGAPIAGSLISTFTTWIYAGSVNGIPSFYSAPSPASFQYSFYIAAVVFLAAGFISLTASEVLGKRKQNISFSE